MDLSRSTGVQIGEHNTQNITYQAPPRPAPVALHSTLPRDIAAFTGREGELHRLLRAAEDGRAPVISIHTVDGMPGVGKTALVTHAAHRLAKRYPDGHRFVDLHAHTVGQPPADPADVLATLLISIGISPQNLPDTLEERAALWRDRLAGSRMLLILDNAAGPDQVEPLLPASPQCLVLVTSRRRLIALDGADPLPLDTLPADQAAHLFTRLARRTPTDTDHSAVTEAVRLCGHLPLAVTLLAARLAHHPTWDLATFTEEFATAQDRLGELEAGNRAVAAAFDLSYQDLPPHLQHLFRHLGLHPGPDIDPHATAALTGVPLARARRHLETLYADHLIEEPAPRRYRLHDLLREYAHTLTTQDTSDTRTQATQRLLNYYTHTAQTADHHLNNTPHAYIPTTTAPGTAPELTTREHALTWMRTEYPNLLACAHHITNHTQPTHLVALAHAMAANLSQQGPWDQAITLHHTAAETARQSNDRLGEAGALRDLGMVRQLTGDYAGAGELAEQALHLYHTLGNRHGEAYALRDLGWVWQLTGDFARAAELAGQALEEFRTLGDRQGEANALQDLGRVQTELMDFTAAADLLDRSRALFAEVGDPQGEAEVLNSTGALLARSGEPQRALDTYEQALVLARQIRIPLDEAHALEGIGRCKAHTDTQAAIISLREAVAIYQRLGAAEAPTAAEYLTRLEAERA